MPDEFEDKQAGECWWSDVKWERVVGDEMRDVVGPGNGNSGKDIGFYCEVGSH